MNNLHPRLILWLGVMSALTFIVTLGALPILVQRIPEDYFIAPKDTLRKWTRGNRLLYLLLLGGKNLLGLFLLAAGSAMLFIPGQGLLTMFLGLTFMNFPGKRRLERSLFRRRPIHRSANWIRRKGGRPPLIVPDDRETAGGVRGA